MGLYHDVHAQIVTKRKSENARNLALFVFERDQKPFELLLLLRTTNERVRIPMNSRKIEVPTKKDHCAVSVVQRRTHLSMLRNVRGFALSRSPEPASYNTCYTEWYSSEISSIKPSCQPGQKLRSPNCWEWWPAPSSTRLKRQRVACGTYISTNRQLRWIRNAADFRSYCRETRGTSGRCLMGTYL